MEQSGTPGTERLSYLLILLLPWLIFTSACSAGEQVAAIQPRPVDGITFHSPLDAYLVNRLGRTEAEIRALIETERANLVSECMSKSGYSVRPNEVYSAKEALDSVEDLLKDFSSHWAADAINRLNEPAPAPDGSHFNPDAHGVQAMMQCQDESTVPSAQSFDQFQDWESEIILDKSQQAQSDERLLTANEQGAECILALGYDVDNFAALSSQFHNRVNEIVDQIGAGELDTDEAIAQLEPIRDEEAAVAQPVNQCTFRAVQVQYDLLTEFELQIIDEHGLELDEWAQLIKRDLESL